MTARFPQKLELPLLLLAAAAAVAAGPEADLAERADLAVTLEARPSPAVAGGVQIYRVEVTNRGPGAASTVTLQHELPPGGVFLGAEPVALDCRPLAGVLVECDLGELDAGAGVELSIGVLFDHRANGRPLSGVVVGADQPDPDGANDQAEFATDVVPVRAMAATTRGGAPALAIVLKEGETSVGLAFADAAGGEREHSVEAPGCRATALAAVPSFAGTPSPELAVLASCLESETRVLVLDSASRELVGDYRVAGDWLPMDVAAIETFAGGAAAELALLLGAREGTETRIKVLDAASGREVRDHLVAGSTAAPAAVGATAPVPIAMVAVPTLGGTPSAELAILARDPGSGEVRVPVIDPDSGELLGDHGLGPGFFPLGIAALAADDGRLAGQVAILLRAAAGGDLHARLLDAASGNTVGAVDFDDALLPGGFAAVPSFGSSLAPELAVFGREDPGLLTLAIKDALTGATVNSIAVASGLPAPVPLGLVSIDRGGDQPAPALAVLFEPYGEPTRVQILEPRPAEPLVSFTLP